VLLGTLSGNPPPFAELHSAYLAQRIMINFKQFTALHVMPICCAQKTNYAYG